MLRGIVAAGMALYASSASGGQIVLDQPHDFVGFVSSEEGTQIGSSRTADDLLSLHPEFVVMEVTAWMIASSPQLPGGYALDIFEHDSDLNQPAGLFQTLSSKKAVDLGPWNNDPSLHLFEVTFEGDAFLGFGIYWFSPYALGNGSERDRGFWGTSGNGEVNDASGHFISEELGYSDWTNVSDPDILGFESDFAMRIEGAIPAPGALVLAPCVVLIARRRRRQ